jgi:hypothetical protein
MTFATFCQANVGGAPGNGLEGLVRHPRILTTTLIPLPRVYHVRTHLPHF